MRVLVNGALGRMGTEVIKKIQSEADLTLAAVVDVRDGIAGGLPVDKDIIHAIKTSKPDVMVDFTLPGVIMDTLKKVLPLGLRCVVGTTGLNSDNLAEIDQLAHRYNTAVLVAPNFALGAVVMMKLAAEAAKYFPDVEIIEKHHDKKIDAPSGTAIMTAKIIAKMRRAQKQGHPEEKETMAGCRGADYEGMKIHSVRLPGYVASQEVIFGGQGETLHISTEPVSRECYMPGVALACRKIKDYQGLVYGLENLL